MINKGSGKNTGIHQREGSREQATYLSEILNLTWHYMPLQDSYQIESKKQTA